MGKTVEASTDTTVHEAIKPQKLKDLIAKVTNAAKTVTDANQRKSELIADAVENEKLHKGAFAVLMKLRKMDPVTRESFRFNLEVYCEREWGPNKDLLRTTGEKPSPQEDDEDLRPRHLRQPDASAAAPSSASAHVKAIADKAEANLSQVGRGPKTH